MANNIENLVPNSARTPEKIRENTRKAGIASGEARRRKRLLRECLEELLEMEIEVKGKKNKKMLGAEALSTQIFQKALKGDLKAFEIIRDTSGQKPVEKVLVADVDPSIIEEVERIVKNE